MDIRVMQYFVTVAKEESYEKKNDVFSVGYQCIEPMFYRRQFCKNKNQKPVETWFADGEHLSVAAQKVWTYCENVDEVRLNSRIQDFFEVYIRQNNKFKEVQLTEKKGKKYKMGTVAVNAKVSYPTDNGDITVDAQNRVLFTGFTTCDYWAKHTSKKQCEKAGRWAHPYIDKVMETDVANTWSGNDMFAYCKNNDNRLYITGTDYRIIDRTYG